ncbi:sensor histidine kinase [Pleurocapsa sp. PCC 7319]|uniref:sensor histidine kinase n=1 Tax=Pleurocapsa sp. PCC 7319 TaxID=118161 RepID=UPI000344AD23|nr:sensor histidine kinase [Pleurocapsa sp. PCC 7319]
MNRLKQLKTYPFGLFLWLECMLLGSAILGELPDHYITAEYDTPEQSIFLTFTLSLLCLLLLGAMGFKLPKKSDFHKWLYFSLQLALIIFATILTKKSFWSIYAYLIVAMRNGLIFKPRQYWLANILLFVSLIPSTAYMRNFPKFQARVSKFQSISVEEYDKIISMTIISSLIEVALCITLICILVNVVLREYKSQQQLAIARQQLRQYALKAEDRATVNERNRIAREIHDSVGHALTAQTIQLNNAIAFWQADPHKAYQFLTEAKGLVATALQEIRHSINTLRSDPLEGKNLEPAIISLFQEFSSRTRIVPDYSISLNYSLTEEVKLTVYRIVQEALTNIAKHSEATSVKVELQTLPEHLCLLIEDNGKGFNPQQNTTGFGLQGMQERVTASNGNIQICSDFNCGCTITIIIPQQIILSIDN